CLRFEIITEIREVGILGRSSKLAHFSPSSEPSRRPALAAQGQATRTRTRIKDSEAVMADQILSVLEELSRDEFEKFTIYLNEDVLEGCAPIPQGKLDGTSVAGVVKLMKSSYGNQVVKVTLEILKKIKRNDLFQGLEKSSRSFHQRGARRDSSLEWDEQEQRGVGGKLPKVAEQSGQAAESIKRAQRRLKDHLRGKFACINEGLPRQGLQSQFHEIYTELYI
ncbi:hypothetical protein GJAV_G00272070, partial [Gymnothorax javanicus]